MPVSKIQFNEYHCIKCGYKWINRVNAKMDQSQQGAPNVKHRIGIEMQSALKRMAFEDA
jgi:hypothetical protein